MVTKDLQTLNLKFDQVMFNSLDFRWERNFEVIVFSLPIAYLWKKLAHDKNYLKVRPPLVTIKLFLSSHLKS